MKKVLLFAFIFMVAMNVKAQNGTKFFSLRGGWVAKHAYTGTLSFDISTRYFNQDEIYGEYYQNYKDHDIKTIMAGFVLKPVLFRSGNTALRFRLGGGLGSTTRRFVAAPQLGLEYAQSIGKGCDLLILNRNQVLFWGDHKDTWRIGLEAGIRIPIN
ncbi:MAG: hypothetical protein AAGC65_07925 [Mucilaginibacter sp.]|uniref:hypothetical protein n=1 Tax=Mucilaginibacter sp. TaxID=1882438 RepID=UPI0031B42E89